MQALPEPLFTDDPEDGEMPPSMDITFKIQAIKQLEQLIEQYMLQQREAKMFYDGRITKCEERIAFLKQAIYAHLQMTEQNSVKTPAGTAYRKTLTIRTWPSDDDLLSWATTHLPAAIHEKREPDKRLIAEHMKTTGIRPPGYGEASETRLYIK